MESVSQNQLPGEGYGWNPRVTNAPAGAAFKRDATIADEVYIVPVVRGAFYLFIASIPFETMDLGIGVELTVITLGLLMMSVIFQLPLVFRRPTPAYAFFALYGFVFTLPVLLQNNYFQEQARWQVVVLIELLAMSWIAYNVMQSEKVARNALLTLALACTLLSVLQLLGVSGREVGTNTDRVSAFGFHPNNLARILTLGLLCLIGLTYGQQKKIIQPQLAVWLAFALIGLTIVKTGSRGGLLALGIGIAVFVMRRGSIGVRIRNGLLVLAGLGFFILLAAQSDLMKARFEEALEDGDLARREKIYPTAWKMFKEEPLLGWGTVTAQYELGARLGHPEEESKNAHNLILQVMISNGFLGLVPLMAGMWLALLAAWRARHGVRGVLPLSLYITVLVANMSGIWITNKMHWLVIAYALSSAGTVYALANRKKIET